MTATVSVVIPVHNAVRFLEECVDSVVAQAGSNVGEILLVDDGSTDGSLGLARSLAARHGSLVEVLTHPGGANSGAGATRNLGVERAACPLIAFLDADDYWLPGRLEGALPALESRPEVDAVIDMFAHRGQGRDETDAFPAIVEAPFDPAWANSRRLAFEAALEYRLRWHVCSVVVRRPAFERCGLFHPALRIHQDTHLWCRMAATLTLARSPLDRPVAVYRRHPGNRFNPERRFQEPHETVGQAEVWRREFTYWSSMVDFMEERRVPFSVWQAILKPYLQAAGRTGDWRTAVRRTLRHSPLQIRHVLRWAWRSRRLRRQGAPESRKG